VSVPAGEGIQRGTVIGLVGNSGLSLEPHLNLEVLDGPDPFPAITLPFTIREFRTRGELGVAANVQ
jgi:murein DD-endopeptidase MepM/ murein hydrolase activator NlpD